MLQQSGDAMKLAQDWFDRFDQARFTLETEKGVNFTPFEWLTVQGNVLTYPTLSEMLTRILLKNQNVIVNNRRPLFCVLFEMN